MNRFTHNFAIHSLSKKVLELIEELEHPRHPKQRLVQREFIDDLYNKGHLTKEEHIFMTVRILFNDFCEEVEEHIGRGVRCGVILYCPDKNMLCYGAGSHYPQQLKNYFSRVYPSVSMTTDEHYKNDIIRLESIDQFKKLASHHEHIIAELFDESDIKSITSKRMKWNGSTFGTFEMVFPVEGGATDEEILFVREKLQPVKEQVFYFRKEMIDAANHVYDRIGAKAYANNPPQACGS